MLISYIVLALGALAALCGHALAGRMAGFGIVALWSAGTAYFVMAPVYSLRVSNVSDLAVLVLFGTVGFALAGTAASEREPALEDYKVSGDKPSTAVIVDLKSVLAELMSLSELGVALNARQIEVETVASSFRCSYRDAVHILSDVLAAVLVEPQVRRVSLHVGRRPGVELLFVAAHRVWPPPLCKTITIGKRAEDCSRANFTGWPPYLTATWFDNGCGQVYQIAYEVSNPFSCGQAAWS